LPDQRDLASTQTRNQPVCDCSFAEFEQSGMELSLTADFKAGRRIHIIYSVLSIGGLLPTNLFK
jgi:hypothetical protein